MGFDGAMQALGMIFQVFLLDLILSGDNAVVIALACRSLPPQQLRKVILIGTGVAILLRILLTTVITFLLALPALKLIGGVALVCIAIKLIVDESATPEAPTEESESDDRDGNRFWSAIGMVIVADLVMSLDNVVALAAAVNGSVVYLIIGLLFSVPLLMVGSLFISRLLNRYPLLVPGVGAMLGWLAGTIAVSDPLVAGWIDTQSPALIYVVPFFCVIFVLLQSKIRKGLPRKPRSSRLPRLQLVRKSPVPIRSTARQQALAVQSADGVKNIPLSFSPALATAETSPSAPQSRQPVRAARSAPIAAKRDWKTYLPPFLQLSKRNAWMLATASLALVLLLFVLLFGEVLLPAPAGLVRYECPGFYGSFSLYYKAGQEKVQIRSGRHAVDGMINNGRIAWDNATDAQSALKFTPPDRIDGNGDDLTSIRIGGGNFLQVLCTRDG
jgi:YjbE family integral membrane protein